MPVVIDATVGGASANAYCTLIEANAYRDTQTVASPLWDDADDDTKNKAIATATRLLDEHVEWKGFVASGTQALQWPRIYVQRDRKQLFWPAGTQPFSWWNAFYEDPASIPQRLKNATAEFARQLIEADRQSDDEVSRKQITAIEAGSVKINFKGYAQPQVLPDTVWYMVQIWGYIRHRAETSVRLRRT